MNEEELVDPGITNNPLNAVAAILLLIQLLLFFLYYNFTANIVVLGFGWLMLIPGLTLVILSAKKDSKVKERLYKFSKFPEHFGWSIISVALSWIIQQWFTFLIAMCFLIVMVLDLRRINVAK